MSHGIHAPSGEGGGGGVDGHKLLTDILSFISNPSHGDNSPIRELSLIAGGRLFSMMAGCQ